MMNEHRALARLATLMMIALLAACGEAKTGSNGSGTAPRDPEPSVVAGTLIGADPFTIGAAALDTGATSFRQDEAENAGSGGLRLGMNFEATGTVAGLLGTTPAMLRDAGTQSAARGPVRFVDAARNRFGVATLTFVVDADTLYDGVAGLAALAPGAFVEVSGLPLADLRTILATRVTQTPAPADGRISIAARIEAVSAQGFEIAGLSVPAQSIAAPPPGSRVRVSGTLDAAASALSNERIVVLPEYAPSAGARVELEGIVLGIEATGGFRLRTPARDYLVTAGVRGALAAGRRFARAA
jgi:hypothetical protein